MRVLITGREGQLVRCLLERGGNAAGIELITVGRPELDLERPGSAAETVGRVAPDVVVSAAAYTAVDQAEDEPDRAVRINGEAPGELALAASRIGAPIIHISTDYVFDGRSPTPYREDAAVGPVSVYGRSKLLGEIRVRAANPDHLILRTAWVYSPFGRNFVKTMMALARTRDEVKVVADQKGSPTSAHDLADGIMAILSRWHVQGAAGGGWTYHLAGTGIADWCAFANRIFAECAALGVPSARALPIASADFPTRAARPACSMLDSAAFDAAFGYRAPDWRVSLAEVVRRLALPAPTLAGE